MLGIGGIGRPSISPVRSRLSYLCYPPLTPIVLAWAGREDVVRLLCQVPGVKDSEAVVSASGIVNTARQMAADRQLNRILPALCTCVHLATFFNQR